MELWNIGNKDSISPSGEKRDRLMTELGVELSLS